MASDLTSYLADRFKQIVGTAGPPPGSHDAVVIAVAASKGGVGKTTTAVHLAAGLGLFEGRRVLLVDLDPQGHVGLSLGAPEPDSDHGLAHVLAERRREVMEVAVPSGVAGLHITLPDKSLNEAERLLTTRIGKEFILQGALKTTRTHYDAIVLDCPPNLGNLTLNALVAADYLLIPCDCAALSVQGLEDILEALAVVRERLRAAVELLGIVVTQFDRRRASLNRQLETLLDERYGAALLGARIGVCAAIARAQLARQTVYRFAPASSGSRDYRALAAEVSRRVFPRAGRQRQA